MRLPVRRRGANGCEGVVEGGQRARALDEGVDIPEELWLAIDSLVQPSAIVSFNGALRPLQGAAGRLFLPIARSTHAATSTHAAG